MRRSPIVLAGTIVGTAGVLAFHPHAPTVQTATATPAPATTGSGSTTSATSSGGSGTGSGFRPAGSTTVSGTATGDAVATQYGNAQVRVTVKGGKIVAITALELQGNDPRSADLLLGQPVLRQEALAKQGADVDAVSGATFTSASYTQSLQSALDKPGFKAPDGSVATLAVPAGGGH